MHVIHDPGSPAAAETCFDDFLKIDIRAGTIATCAHFPEARRPSYILTIHFGPAIGLRKSVAQITDNHTPEDLVGRQVMAIVNLPARQIGPVRSEVLVLGFPDDGGCIRLAGIGGTVPDGARLA